MDRELDELREWLDWAEEQDPDDAGEAYRLNQDIAQAYERLDELEAQ